MAYHNELGAWGEELATSFLVKKGYTILARNFTFQKAEIDIVAQKEKDTLVVVEVKTRNSDVFGDPQSFVSKKKIQQLVKATDHFMVSNGIDAEVRFDIIAILKNTREESLQHIENAFYHF